MHYGFRIIEDLCDGLANWMEAKGFATIGDVVGRSLHRISDFKDFDLSFSAVARIDPVKCIQCNLCYVACNDSAHQCIDLIDASGRLVAPFSYSVQSNGRMEATETRPRPVVREEDCVGCRLCHNVCPVQGCIEMVAVESGRPSLTWDQLMRAHPEVGEDWEAMKRYREAMGIHIH
jgi:dihydropyrimidine dehydrogenase (NAD+) subunit PreA